VTELIRGLERARIKHGNQILKELLHGNVVDACSHRQEPGMSHERERKPGAGAADEQQEGKPKSMLRVAAVLFALGSMSEAAFAQWDWGGSWDPWDDRPRSRSPYYQPPPPPRGFYYPWEQRDPDRPDTRRPPAPAVRSGGARPEIAPVEPRRIAFPSSYPVGGIIIDQKGRQLILVESATEALHYPISVGR